MTTLPTSQRGRATISRLAKETTINVMPTAGWKPARFYDIGAAGMSRGLVKDDQLGVPGHNDRDPTLRRQGLPGGSLQRVVPLNLNEIPHWLSAGFARSSSGAGPNYVHAFSSAGDPTDTLTLVEQWPSGQWTSDHGVALASMQIQAQKAETTARAILTLIGLSDNDNLGGAPTGTVASAYAADDFSDWRWAGYLNDVLVGDLTNVDLTLDMGVERIQGLSGDEYPTKHHFGDRNYTGSFRLYGMGEAIQTLAVAGTVEKFTLKATHPSDTVNRFFKVDLPLAQFAKRQRAVSGPGQQSANFSFEASQDATNDGCAVTVANGIATY